MKKENIIRLTADEARVRAEQSCKETDWARIDRLTDADIDAATRDDPDWQEFADVDWSKAVLVLPPEKQAISIRLDRDVIDFFKAQGSGYRTRINAVLRHFMDARKPRKAG